MHLYCFVNLMLINILSASGAGWLAEIIYILQCVLEVYVVLLLPMHFSYYPKFIWKPCFWVSITTFKYYHNLHTYVHIYVHTFVHVCTYLNVLLFCST